MKNTGITRKLDELGRIVLPIELRRTLDINCGDALEIFVEGEQIVLRKFCISCVFCAREESLTNIKGKQVCKTCIEEIKKL